MASESEIPLSQRAAYALKKQEKEATRALYRNLDPWSEVKTIPLGETRLYDPNVLTGPQRMLLTLAADRHGLAAYKEGDKLVIGPPRQIRVQINDAFLGYFARWTNKPFAEVSTFLSDVALFGLEKELQHCQEDVRRFGLDALKRRDEILCQQIVKDLTSREAYRLHVGNAMPREKQRHERLMEQKVYFANHPQDAVFVSLDVRSSLFKAYHDLEIILEPSWEEFMRKYTSSEWMIHNKTMRLACMGKLDRHQRHAELIRGTIEPIVHLFDFEWSVVEGDEIVFRFTEQTWKDALAIIEPKVPSWIRVQCYRLERGPFFVRRHFLHGSQIPWDIKCCAIKRLKEAYLSDGSEEKVAEIVPDPEPDASRPLLIYTRGQKMRPEVEHLPDFDASKISYNPKRVKLFSKTGMDPFVSELVLASSQSKRLIRNIIRKVETENLNTIVIHCMHGRHRSVAIANHLVRILYPRGRAIHLELNRRTVGTQN